jgi:hypothetical protein
MTPKKSKAHHRFQMVNHLVDEIVPFLPSPTHAAALFVCWRHADHRGIFCLSHQRIATAIGISRRHAITIVTDLESRRVLMELQKGSGTSASKYKITGIVDGASGEL